MRSSRELISRSLSRTVLPEKRTEVTIHVVQVTQKREESRRDQAVNFTRKAESVEG
jgi:hypothetical protein